MDILTILEDLWKGVSHKLYNERKRNLAADPLVTQHSDLPYWSQINNLREKSRKEISI